jgi:cytochrome c
VFAGLKFLAARPIPPEVQETAMRHHLGLTLLAAALALPALASSGRDDAVALVKHGVARIQAAGAERAYAEITGGNLAQRGELHLVVYSFDGDCLAHGANPAQVGRNLLEQTDIEGRFLVKERVLMAQAMPHGFWHEHKQANLLSKRIEPRLMYCEKVADTAVCAGTRR